MSEKIMFGAETGKQIIEEFENILRKYSLVDVSIVSLSTSPKTETTESHLPSILVDLNKVVEAASQEISSLQNTVVKDFKIAAKRREECIPQPFYSSGRIGVNCCGATLG